MAISTTAAILGSAAIGAAGSIIGGSSASRAADRAADSQVDVARENNALARDFRADNEANFAPWLQSGGRANSLVDSFLFGPQAMTVPAQQAPQTSQITGANIPYWKMPDGIAPTGAEFRAGDGTNTGGVPQGTVNTGTPTAGAGQNAMMDGYQTFVNSPFYQFPLQEGLKSLNQGYAANGMIQSGDAMKGITRFGQDYASGRMGEFIGLAERQSDRGLQGAGAIAGVGMNALSSMSANNQNAANALSNAAIARGNATAGMFSGIGSALGGALGQLGGSSYGNPSWYGAYPSSGPMGM